MTDNEKILNPGLFKVHRLVFMAFAGFSIVIPVIGALALIKGEHDPSFAFVGLVGIPFAALHWFAAQGAKKGLSSGKLISRIVATFWLIGFPVGTLLGIYVWSQTFSKWNSIKG